MFFFMNPLTGDVWLYVALAYIFVSLSLWIIARFSPLEWYSLKHSNAGETFCHEHDSKVFNVASSSAARPPPGTAFSHNAYPADERQTCCHHLSPVPPPPPPLPSRKSHVDKELFEKSEESDFNKHQQPPSPVLKEGENCRQPDPPPLPRDTEFRNEFQSYNEGCSCDNPSSSLPQCERAVFRSLNDNRKVPADNPLDLLADMPSFDVANEVRMQHECNDHHLYAERHDQHEANLRHSHNETELLTSTNDFTLSNSFWFMIGTLMQQGSELNPKVKSFSPIKLPRFLLRLLSALALYARKQWSGSNSCSN